MSMHDLLPQLQTAPLFVNMNAEEIAQALVFFDAKKATYAKGNTLIRPGDPLTAFGLVLSGRVQASMDDISGNRIIMADVSPGDIFSESLSYQDAQASPLYITAVAHCEVLWLAAKRLRHPAISQPMQLKVFQNFLYELTRRILSMNDRIQVLSKRTLRDKLITFFSQQVKRQGSTTLTLAMDRNEMADYLGTDRSALSRELSRMQQAGLLRFHKNKFVLLADVREV